ncbi:T9SS type A sorting domain-containing protein [Terrimonas sp. NA20]|uniref:T9SS type A sorting domain-containing protein n=1 Tax=Terrimonas ginsenosidimutans TaxID=2908004 RepID=A0ABS9KPX5_9BACT|nr:T9SS type A sorting domain-containing protein [Terrimonas ginsenosidimutans]MCG2614375.1 T9SS type A sorting domain-containing protein [Terrimonas ginsenosidimutans]
MTEQLPGKIVKLYPNPAKSYITFDFDKDQQKGRTITIYSFLGKKMYEGQTVTEKTTVTLNDYNRGMYIYHLTDAAGKIVESGKFQVTQ